ncbi:hypothetical protein SAMN06265348_103290 [Pedobacter westerhofensis]|uniref:Uncharacterized protein n=1 Tax=Pedobacter westerhofensis TaxID=425512 RepID=A0A521C7V4_9SPHI|nr:hypothetical protein SAMN06265348_103290 [Pedobacter westerhofensis]
MIWKASSFSKALALIQRAKVVPPTSRALPPSIDNNMLPQATPLTDRRETAERRPGSAERLFNIILLLSQP